MHGCVGFVAWEMHQLRMSAMCQEMVRKARGPLGWDVWRDLELVSPVSSLPCFCGCRSELV